MDNTAVTRRCNRGDPVHAPASAARGIGRIIFHLMTLRRKFVPACAQSFRGYGKLGRMTAQQIACYVFDGGEVGRGVFGSDAAFVSLKPQSISECMLSTAQWQRTT